MVGIRENPNAYRNINTWNILRITNKKMCLKEYSVLRQPYKLLQAVLDFVGSIPASIGRDLEEELRLSSHDVILAILDQLSAVHGKAPIRCLFIQQK